MLRWAVCGVAAVGLLGCDGPLSTTLVKAPPGPADLGPATGLSTPPADAVVFDLKYVAQTGGKDDIQYHSYWGYGGSDSETKTNSFLEDVRKRASRLYYVCNYSFTGRKWAAVEHDGRQALALYFDVDADGKLGEGERIPPTRKAHQGVEFITPDFVQPLEGGGQVFCRTLLQASFYKGNSEPNCMWSPAALLEGSAVLNGKSTRLLLFASSPGGSFDKFGSSSCSLLSGDQARTTGEQYVSREQLSSLVLNEGHFYRLTVEGRRSNGLPARVMLVKDNSPAGTLVVKVSGSNSLQSALSSLYLSGVDDKTVFLRANGTKGRVTLPVGAYALNSGAITYGATNAQDWEVSFSQAPRATIKAGEVMEVALGQPALTVRAVEERDRYDSGAVGSATFKQGTQIYLEPRVVGQGKEVFGRFQQTVANKNGNERTERPPKVTITGPDGKQLLSSTMEYG